MHKGRRQRRVVLLEKDSSESFFSTFLKVLCVKNRGLGNEISGFENKKRVWIKNSNSFKYFLV